MFTCCVTLLHLLLINSMLYFTHTLLNVNIILYRYIHNKNLFNPQVT
jgi:hypothetical protein